VIRNIHRYMFDDKISLYEIRNSLFLAMFSAEDMLDWNVEWTYDRLEEPIYHLDKKKHACVLDVSTPMGRTVARIFNRLLTRQFGEFGFDVERIDVIGQGLT